MDITVNGAIMQVPVFPETSSAQQAEVAGGVSSESAADRPPPDQQVMQEVAAAVQEDMGGRNVSLSFSTYGKKNDKISVTVIDKDTGEVIREIPPEELQRLAGKLEEMVGTVFDGRV